MHVADRKTLFASEMLLKCPETSEVFVKNCTGSVSFMDDQHTLEYVAEEKICIFYCLRVDFCSLLKCWGGGGRRGCDLHFDVKQLDIYTNP